MNKDYEKQAEKILSLDSIWKNKSEQFKKLSIKFMANTLKYIENIEKGRNLSKRFTSIEELMEDLNA